MLTSSVRPPHNTVHKDTSDPISQPQQPIFMALRYLATRPCWPRLSYDPIPGHPPLWRCNKWIISGSHWQCPCVCLCRCTNIYISHQFIITINSHQAYIIILTQHFNNYITRLKVTRQWPLAAARNNLAAVEQQARCRGEAQQLGLSNPSQLVAARTILAIASALCLSQTKHEVQNSIYYSQSEPTR